MQVRAESMRMPGAQDSVALSAMLGRWQRPALPWKTLPTRQVMWIVALVIAMLLLRAGSRVWSFEGTTVAASARETASTEPAASRAFYGRRLEPKEPVVLHGAGQLDEANFSAYSAAMAENSPLLTASSVDLFDDLPGYFAQLRQQLDRAQGPGGKSTLVPQIALSLNGGGLTPHRLERLQNGKEERRLNELVNGLRSLHQPVFLRLGPRCNAPENGYEPAHYIAAFQRIARAIRAADLKQVALVWEWSPDAELDVQAEGARERDAAERWAAFYPGDDSVDWWGLTLYSEPAINSKTTAAFLSEADRRGFPVMIAEATPKGHEVSEGSLILDTWFRPFFRLIERSRGVKAFCYLDRDWRPYPQWSTWGDARVEANPEVLGYMRGEMGELLFAHARGRERVEALLQLR